jgi:hypothetical protein
MLGGIKNHIGINSVNITKAIKLNGARKEPGT